MAHETNETEVGPVEDPGPDDIEARLERVDKGDRTRTASYDLSDLNLEPDVVAKHVLLQRAEIEAQEAGVAGWLAKVLMGLLCAGSLLYVVLGFLVSVESGLEAGTRILCFLTPLVGVVVGYYFSGKRQRS